MKNFSRKPLIFAAIGVANTGIDLAIYVALRGLGVSALAANITSTSAALLFSYVMNSRFTFKAQKFTAKSFALYLAVTLFGLWVIQTGVIYLLAHALQQLPASFWQMFGPFNDTARFALPKLCATAVTLLWNYLWYNKVIFRQQPLEDATVAINETLPLSKP